MSNGNSITTTAGWCAPTSAINGTITFSEPDPELFRLIYGGDPASYEETMNMDTDTYPANTAPGVYDEPTSEAMGTLTGTSIRFAQGPDAEPRMQWSSPVEFSRAEPGDSPEPEDIRTTFRREDAVAEMLRASARLLEASANALDAR